MDYSIFDNRYYLDGKANHLSLYENYRWLESLTPPLAKRISEVLGIRDEDTICDFGCARGYIVRAFRELGYAAWGIDASAWAIENCDPSVEDYVKQATAIDTEYDWLCAKDVLEHIPEPDLTATIDNLLTHARKGVFVVVPLSPAPGEPYVVPEYEQDVTHVQREPLTVWADKFRRPGFCVTATYLIPGIKDNYAHIAEGNGFLVVRRDADD